MPNFDLRVHSGASAESWDDPRLNHRGSTQHLYRRVYPQTWPAVTTVELRAVVGGVEAPLDVDLGGDLFHAARISFSGSFPFAITQPAGQSSKILLSLSAHQLGHQELVVRRDNGGAIFLSFEVEELIVS